MLPGSFGFTTRIITLIFYSGLSYSDMVKSSVDNNANFYQNWKEPSKKNDGNMLSTDEYSIYNEERVNKNKTVLRTLFLPKVKNGIDNPYSDFEKDNGESKIGYKSHDKNEYAEDLRSLGDGTNYEAEEESFCNPPIKKTHRLKPMKLVKNGRVLFVTKVLKSRKCKKLRTRNDAMQRRTFNIIPTLSSMLPIPWMTKKEDADITGYNFTENKRTQTPVLRNEEDSESGQFHIKTPPQYHEGNKLKTLLNLFTIVKFDNGECYANDLKGTCLHEVECQAKDGKPMGFCAQGFGICCYIERTCGGRTRENFTYFVNERFPQPSTQAPKVCTLIVEKAHSEVQQLRLEFVAFELRGPNNGTCISDRFTVTGHNANDVVPDICGINNRQHVYVDVDDSKGPYNLNIITMGNDFPRTFQIKITQIGKNDELIAPKNCLQYYHQLSGEIESFNYQYNGLRNLPEAIPGYFNNLNYAICFKKHKGFCSISYESSEQEDINNYPAFQILNVDSDGGRLVPPSQAGAETFDCPDDYIIINGIRLCGERLNDASIDADYTKNLPVTEFGNGPFTLQVRTSNAINGRGFYLKYRQNPCLQ